MSLLPPAPRALWPALALLALACAPAAAHPHLVAPSGGVTLTPGTVYQIQWTIYIPHVTTSFELHYSTTGPAGPWLPIATGLDSSGSQILGTPFWYYWTVPNTVSGQVYVRVTQVNVGPSYTSASSTPNEIIAAPVSSTTPTISAASGGLYDLALSLPTSFAGDAYVVGGSFAGPVTAGLINVESFRFGAIYLPIRPDWYTTWSTDPTNPATTGFAGLLDASGGASASLQVPPNLSPAVIGHTVYHSCIVVTAGSASVAGNAVGVTITP